MKIFSQIKIFIIFFLGMCVGCDFVYGLLQKEGAQEKKLLGEVMPSVYNENVELVQKLLLLHGVSPGKVDGKFGAQVRQAIAKFQEQNDLPVSRFVDQRTWQALNAFSATGLVEGGRIDLFAVQEALAAAGFNPGTPDGRQGPKTTKAIKDFQKSRGLAADGRVGKKTLSALNDVLLLKAR